MLLRADKHQEKGGALLSLSLWIVIMAFLGLLVPEYTIGLFSKFLVVQDKPQQSDAIVVMLGANTPDRVLKANELYQQGLAQRIVFGTGFVHDRSNFPQEFRWPTPSFSYRLAFESLGFNQSNMLILNTSQAFDSSNELSAIAEYARSVGWNSIILVSSASHSRRVDLIWDRVAPDIRHYTVPAPQAGLKEWWKSSRYRSILFREYGALVKEGWSQFLRFTDFAIKKAKNFKNGNLEVRHQSLREDESDLISEENTVPPQFNTDSVPKSNFTISE